MMQTFLRNTLSKLPEQYFGKSNLYFIVSLFLFIILGIILRLDCFEATRITEWVARDFDRSFHLFDGDYIPLAGPERNAGGRLLGPFLYFLTAIPLFFHYSYESIYTFNLLLNVISLLFFIWIVKRFFGNITAYFSGALLSLSVIHIDMAGLPINPTFMLPFSILFFWLLFEFTVNEKTHYFPWIIFLISLAIQIHFSIASYYLIPLAALYVYEIKINWKLVLKTLALLIVCFLPYWYYKNQFYEPNIQITKTFFNQGYSFFDLIKSAFLGNLLIRLSEGTSLYGYHNFPTYFISFQFYILSISFYGLAAITIWNLKKEGFNSCKKEILLLLSLYIPGITYEIMNPPTGWHFWHYFIFLAPTILISGRFFHLISHKIKQKNFKIFIFSLTQCVFLFIAILVFNKITKTNYLTSTQIRNGDFYNSANLKDFMGDMMTQLKLSPEEFHKNVYLEGISAESKYFLKLSHKSTTHNDKKSPFKNQCYYLFEKPKLLPNYRIIDPNKKQRLNLFLSDPSISLSSSSNFQITIKGKNNVKVFSVYPYSTNFEQPCYSNHFNRFLVNPETRTFLKNSFNINKKAEDNQAWKIISNDIEFDTNSNLQKLTQTSIFFDQKLNTPIQIKTKLEIFNDVLTMQNNLIFYAWPHPSANKFQLKEANLSISKNNKKKTSFQIIDPKSWITSPLNLKTADNFSWGRTFKIKAPFPLKKDQFKLDLTLKYFYPARKTPCCETISLHIPLKEN
jgi:4-amino-4-deoxy-L-arabinose transferase-like glycosyltransferase